MNSKLHKIFTVCFIASLLCACQTDQSNAREDSPSIHEDSTVIKVQPVNPNGDSELALLMRQMYLDAEKVKQQIINEEGDITDEFIAELEKVHSAIPTDPEVKTPDFTVFNDQLIASAKAIQKDENDKTSQFNHFVDRCIACHRSYCPGPVKRIKKLRIKSKK